MDSATIEIRWSTAARSGSSPRRHVARVNPLRRLIDWFRDELRIRRGTEELMALDDRMLADIGLTRGYVERAARYGTSLDRMVGLINGLPTRPDTTFRSRPCARS